jgi:membrane-associated phospholipid phosphatase
MTARRLYLLAAALCFVTLAALLIALPVAAYCRQFHTPEYDLQRITKVLLKVVLLAEVFAHGYGATAILLTVFVIDPGRRRWLPRLVVLVAGAGVVGNLVKALIVRWRPSHRAVESVWESFGGWLPDLVYDSIGAARPNDLQSFPSGHAITAVTLAIGLTSLYPRGRWLFAVFAGLAMLQRLATSAHYPSDTLAGAALACFLAAVLFDSRLCGRWFDRREAPARSVATQ